MWSWVVFIYSVLFVFLGGAEIFDVTTVYNIGGCNSSALNLPKDKDNPQTKYKFGKYEACSKGIKRTVFAGPKAVGLGVTDGRNTYKTKVQEELNIACVFPGTCNWTMEAVKEEIKDQEVYPVIGTTEISFENSPKNSVILFSENIVGKGPYKFYRVRFQTSKVLLGKCNSHEEIGHGNKNRTEPKYQTSCHEISNFTFNSDYFRFLFENKTLYIGNDQRTTKEAFIWKDENFMSLPGPIDVKSFTIEKSGTDKPSLLHKGDRRSDGIHGTTMSMVSPLFTPIDKTLCLAFMFHAESNSGDKIEVHVEDHLLTTIKGTKVGLNEKLVNAKLSGRLVFPIKVAVKFFGNSKKIVKSIVPCDHKGITILPPLPSSEVCSTTYIPVFNVANYAMGKELSTNTENLKNETCQNGGKATLAGCACPAGFTKSDCSQGCGRNRFGQDCSRTCSVHTRECKGLLLCVPEAGCHCAPGYSGSDCSTECLPGHYGADCTQTCGECYMGIGCDIYTGECDMCAPGYVPPYCKEAYVYYGSKPALLVRDDGKVRVTFDPRNFMGYGTPKLYQLEYRTKGEDWRIHTTKIIPPIRTSKNYIYRKKHYISEDVGELQHGLPYEFRVLYLDENLNKYSGPLVQTSQVFTKCDVPNSTDYNLSTQSDENSISFSWTFTDEKNWCSEYEVVWEEDWERLSYTTTARNITITDLLPGSEIPFKVRAVIVRGNAPFSKTVKAKTTDKRVTAVRGLHVVSNQGTALKIAWQPPLHNGNKEMLKYNVTYQSIDQPLCSSACQEDGSRNTVESTHFTLSSLLPFTQYFVVVAPQDGPRTGIIVGTTKAASPSLEKVEVINVSPTSVVLKWPCPNLISGPVHSFIISGQETETFVQNKCCKKIPPVEIPANEAQLLYKTMITDLQPAATYTINITAKNLDMGPPQSLLVHTQPPNLQITEIPSIHLGLVKNWSWLSDDSYTTTEDYASFSPLIKERFILANGSQFLEGFSTGVNNSQVDALIQAKIGGPYIKVAEYKNKDENITIGETDDVNMIDVRKAPVDTPFIVGQRYQLVIAQVTEYRGVYNVDLLYSTMFPYP